MRFKKLNNKQAVSPIIAYVMLIIIVLSLSIMVYSWLKDYVPKGKTECPEGLSLVVESYSCKGMKIDFNFKNNGRFNVDGFLIKVQSNPAGIQSFPLTDRIYQENTFEYGFSFLTIVEEDGKEIKKSITLKPGEKISQSFSYSEASQIYSFLVIPARQLNNNFVLCENQANIYQVSSDECKGAF